MQHISLHLFNLIRIMRDKANDVVVYAIWAWTEYVKPPSGGWLFSYCVLTYPLQQWFNIYLTRTFTFPFKASMQSCRCIFQIRYLNTCIYPLIVYSCSNLHGWMTDLIANAKITAHIFHSFCLVVLQYHMTAVFRRVPSIVQNLVGKSEHFWTLFRATCAMVCCSRLTQHCI